MRWILEGLRVGIGRCPGVQISRHSHNAMNVRHQIYERETCVLACGNSWYMLEEIERCYSRNNFVGEGDRSIEQVALNHIWMIAPNITTLNGLRLKGIFGIQSTAKIQ